MPRCSQACLMQRGFSYPYYLSEIVDASACQVVDVGDCFCFDSCQRQAGPANAGESSDLFLVTGIP